MTNSFCQNKAMYQGYTQWVHTMINKNTILKLKKEL